MTETECRCGRPAHNAYVCDHCTDELAKALGDIPWLSDELETTISKQGGVDYRRGSGTHPKPAEMPSPVSWSAADARTHLRALLVAWVRFCDEEQVRNSSPYLGLPDDNVTAMSRWLLWRVNGLAILEIGAEAVDELTSAVAHCHRLIDRPAERQYLGTCGECESGSLHARAGSQWARCDECGVGVEAATIRDKLLKELDDRLCTAAEIARLTTYLGLRQDRERVRNRINQWHKRNRITREHAFTDEPVFRFGIVWRLLQAEDDAAKVG